MRVWGIVRPEKWLMTLLDCQPVAFLWLCARHLGLSLRRVANQHTGKPGVGIWIGGGHAETPRYCICVRAWHCPVPVHVQNFIFMLLILIVSFDSCLL